MKRAKIAISLFMMIFSSISYAKKYAVLIGINTYPYLKDADLRAPENDVMSLETSLITEIGLLKKDIIILKSNQATALKIKSAIIDEHRDLRQEDLFIVYFSGHGTIYHGRSVASPEDYRQYILSYDAESNKPSTWIGFYDLANWLKRVPGEKLVILDACYAGGGKSYSMRQSGVKALFAMPEILQGNPLESAGDTIVYASSSQADEPEPAYELDKIDPPQSVFTHYFIQAIRQHKTGKLTITKATNYVIKQISDKQIPERQQTPRVYSPAGTLPLVLLDRDYGDVTLVLEHPIDRSVEVWLDNEKKGLLSLNDPLVINRLHISKHKLIILDPKK
ncbi:TPA: caspase family protein, partial [Candidatus Poribacteria bacterium]|nr:caspase family protein [Candidatus Poribacteria bacterium]